MILMPKPKWFGILMTHKRAKDRELGRLTSPKPLRHKYKYNPPVELFKSHDRANYFSKLRSKKLLYFLLDRHYAIHISSKRLYTQIITIQRYTINVRLK